MSSDFPLPKPALRVLPRSRLTVGTILKEPIPTVLRFVAWYLAQDADRIVLCFDDPEDPAIDLMQHVERVECIRCTPDFWTEFGLSPETRFTKRQNRAMTYVYSTVAAGWFLNVDSDELLHLDGRSLAEEVDAQPEDVRAVRVEPIEHVQTPDSDGMHFRCMMRPWMQRRVYGDLAPVVKMRAGLMGHTQGKSITRSGLRDIVVRQHWFESRTGEVVGDRVLGREDGAYLLHFVDQGFENWCAKLPWRLSTRGFRGPMRDIILEILEEDDPTERIRNLYDTLFIFPRDRLELLGEVRSRYDLNIHPDDVVDAVFPRDFLHAARRRSQEISHHPLHFRAETD